MDKLMQYRFGWILIFGCLACSLASAAMAQSENTGTSETVVVAEEPALSALGEAVKSRLEKLSGKSKAQSRRAQAIRAWYAARNYEPLWLENGRAGQRAEAAIHRLLTAYEDGLIASEYGATGLFAMVGSDDATQLADFEVLLSSKVALYAQHLYSGRVTPSAINRELVIFPKTISADKVLQRLADVPSPASELLNMTPETPRYDRLRKHLLALRILDAQGGFTEVPKGEVLKPGQTDTRLDGLRQRLQQSQDLPKGAHSGDVYDGNLVKAVKYYQWRNGLTIDGVVGPGTLAQLNVSVGYRISQVELNLERRRWMQNDYGDRYIFVNLADQVLKLVENGKTKHAEIVQVGLPFHRTPVFTDSMEYLEFNPYWNVPYSIATKEYLPKLKRNPFALQSANIRVLRGGTPVSAGSIPWGSYSRSHFPVRLRQEPGPKNALGRVKFMFPNKYNIYIHDTPAKSKFTRSSRYFSHGCVRLNRPFKFAQKLLKGQGTTLSKMNAIRKSGKRTVVRLKQKIPVHITYLTAWVNKDGSVHYRRDVYGRDKILKKALVPAG